MKSVVVAAPDRVEVLDIAPPMIGSKDVLVQMRACGICGADPHAVHQGGIIPGVDGAPLGHEPAGEVVEVGGDVRQIRVGDHVVIDPTQVADAIIGGGGPQGALSEFVAVRDAVAGRSVIVIADEIPWQVAALVEPLAVARRGVDRTAPRSHHKVVVFGAGPVGLGALLAFKHYGVAHVVVADVQVSRLETATMLGADAVIDSSTEDVRARLVELHGSGSDAFGRPGLPDTDIYLDAAGANPVLETVFAGPKQGAVLGIVGIHQRPLAVDFQGLIPSELTIVHSMGHPDGEMQAVALDMAQHIDAYASIVSDTFPVAESAAAIELAGRPGATSKVVVTFD